MSQELEDILDVPAVDVLDMVHVQNITVLDYLPIDMVFILLGSPIGGSFMFQDWKTRYGSYTIEILNATFSIFREDNIYQLLPPSPRREVSCVLLPNFRIAVSCMAIWNGHPIWLFPKIYFPKNVPVPKQLDNIKYLMIVPNTLALQNLTSGTELGFIRVQSFYDGGCFHERSFGLPHFPASMFYYTDQFFRKWHAVFHLIFQIGVKAGLPKALTSDLIEFLTDAWLDLSPKLRAKLSEYYSGTFPFHYIWKLMRMNSFAICNDIFIPKLNSL